MQNSNLKQLNPNISVDMSDLLGKGSTGDVYRGVSLQQHSHPIAVKVIPLQQINNQVTSYLLQCQLQALKATSKCSNQSIVKLEQIIVCDNNCYVAMQLLEGGTLKEYITESKKLEVDKALYILRKLLQGYKILKQNGIVHRDLKPQNILLLRKPTQDQNQIVPKIIDFGYCSMEKVQRKPKMFYNVGSPRYMSPQAYTNNKYSQKSDIWALGIIFYEMLTGTNFDKGKNIVETFKLIKQKGIPIPSSLNHHCRSILQHMLLLDPNRRHSCQQILEQLNDQQVATNNQLTLSNPSSYPLIEQPHIKNSLRQLRNTIITEKRLVSPVSKSPTIKASFMNNNQSILRNSGFLTRSVGFNVSPQAKDTHLSVFNSNQLNFKFEKSNIFNNAEDKFQYQAGPSTERKKIAHHRIPIKQVQTEHKKLEDRNYRLKYNQNSNNFSRTLNQSASEQNIRRFQNQILVNRTSERQNILVDTNTQRKNIYERVEQARKTNNFIPNKNNQFLRMQRILTSPNNRAQININKPIGQTRSGVPNQKINFTNTSQNQRQIQHPSWNGNQPTIHIVVQNSVQHPSNNQQQILSSNPNDLHISQQQQQIHQVHQLPLPVHQQVLIQHQSQQQSPPVIIQQPSISIKQQPISNQIIHPQQIPNPPLHQSHTNITNQIPLSTQIMQGQQKNQFNGQIHTQNTILNRNIRIIPATPHNQQLISSFKPRQTIMNQFNTFNNQIQVRPRMIEQTHI